MQKLAEGRFHTLSQQPKKYSNNLLQSHNLMATVLLQSAERINPECR
jgi:hypothetical protein